MIALQSFPEIRRSTLRTCMKVFCLKTSIHFGKVDIQRTTVKLIFIMYPESWAFLNNFQFPSLDRTFVHPGTSGLSLVRFTRSCNSLNHTEIITDCVNLSDASRNQVIRRELYSYITTLTHYQDDFILQEPNSLITHEVHFIYSRDALRGEGVTPKNLGRAEKKKSINLFLAYLQGGMSKSELAFKSP